MPGGSTPQQQQQTQQTTSNSQPPPAIEGALKTGVGNIWQHYLDNPNAPAYYPGSTVAPQSGATGAAIQTLYERGAHGSPLIRAGGANLTDTVNGKYLDIGHNPYFQKALAAGFAPQTENFNNNILPNLRSQFEGSGRNLGGADFNTSMRALKDLDVTQSNAAAGASNAAYNQERNNQFTAAGMMPAYAASDYNDINAMGQAGAANDAYAQRRTDADIARYNYGNNSQLDYISNILARLNAGYPGGSSSGSGSSTGSMTPSDNPTGNLIGGGLGIAGLAAKFLPFSDKRLKTDIKAVGKLHDGQKVYSYRFLGEPHHQIGLMAQEVEKRNPGAVVTDEQGWKHVDYAAATAPAGGLL